MTSAVWFGIGLFMGIAMGAALFYEYKTTMTNLMDKLEIKYQQLVNIISNWQKEITKK